MPGINDALDGKSHQGLFESRPAPASRHRARSAIDNHSQPDRRRAAPVWHLLQPAFALPEEAHTQEIGCQRLAAATDASVPFTNWVGICCAALGFWRGATREHSRRAL